MNKEDKGIVAHLAVIVIGILAVMTIFSLNVKWDGERESRKAATCIEAGNEWRQNIRGNFECVTVAR